MKKTKFFRIMTVVLLVAGICVLFYPAVVNIIFVAEQNKVVDEYNRQVQELEQSNIDTLKQQAQQYNDRLAGAVTTTPADNSGESAEADEALGYDELLNVSGNQMGYVVIPKISVNLPIYHYSNDAVLSVGVGHLENTSLPVGGVNTHAVLTGHTGLPGAKIFTDLEKLEVGDRFYVKTLDEILCYEVDRIKVVLPNDARDLQIIEGRDLVTLFTCTPYGLNTHRLLVRGTRVPYGGELDDNNSAVIVTTAPSLETQPVSDNASVPDNAGEPSPPVNVLLEKSGLSDEFVRNYIIIPVFIAMAVIVLVIIIFKRGSKKKQAGKNDEA